MNDKDKIVHSLKTWPEYYEAMATRLKKFELRKNDRNFQVGDFLRLQEYDPKTNQYTGRETTVEIFYILEGGTFGLDKGYCVMSVA
jgi:hypothetical protein